MQAEFRIPCSNYAIICNCMYVLVFPACCYPPSSYCPYHGQCFHKHEPRKGCGVIYTCRQGSQGAEACYLSGSRSNLPRSGDFDLCPTYIFPSFLLPLMNISINLQLLIPLVVLCLVSIAVFQSRNVMRVTA